jgi:hypothetical protein
MMECPTCKSELANNASYCGCGWKAKKAKTGKGEYTVYPPQAPCSHDGCFVESLCRIKTIHGWANLCERHYYAYWQAQGDRKCAELGLITTAQKRASVLANAGRLAAKFKPDYTKREPGEDEEYRHREIAEQLVSGKIQVRA